METKLKKLASRKVSGMTLIELLLVLALVGILLSMAVPRLLPLIGKTKSLEAQMQLKHLLTLEKNFFYLNSRYSADLSEVGYEQEKLVSENGKANYKIEVLEAGNKAFVARATAITDFDQDGEMNVWQITQTEELKELTRD